MTRSPPSRHAVTPTSVRRTPNRHGWPRSAVRAVAAALLLVSTALSAQDFSIDWHTIDGGGEVLAETVGGQWQLSGTLGQWDSTELQAVSGGASWTLTGGFWPVSTDPTRPMFKDGFEG